MMKAKQVKNLISDVITDRKEGISVVLGSCDDYNERIEIKYRKTSSFLSLNPIQTILHKNNFYVAQIIDFYYKTKRVILLIREPENEKLSNFQKRKLGLKKSWVSYKGKTIVLNFEPRKGICSICEKENEHTILHHEQYDDSDPLAHTIEVCAKCHGDVHKH